MNNNNISKYVNNQLKNLLIFDTDISQYVDVAMKRSEECFVRLNNKYYSNDAYLVTEHSGKYSIFLFCLSSVIYKAIGVNTISSKLYYLNKILHGVDWYYEIDLPLYWGVEHPIGSVLGRAKYSNGLFIYQGCTIGGNKGKYPVIGENLIMYSNSKILGESVIGNNVLLASDTTIIDREIPSNCIVFGRGPDLVIKEYSESEIMEKISLIWK